MSSQEQDREDLLREATALVERAEIQLSGVEESVVIGFRRNGAASVYYNANLVYQFNARHELRRAFQDGCLIKAVRGQLVQMERQRTQASTELVTHPLSSTIQANFLAAVSQVIQELLSQIEDQQFKLVGQVPAEANVMERIRQWLTSLPSPIIVAKAPNA